MNSTIALIALFLQYSDKLTQIGKLLATAHAEGRDVTDAELDALFAQDDAARAQLQAAISAAAKPGTF